MVAKNYYTLLGVDKQATQQEIKSAYRKLAKELHPDLNPGNPDVETKFKEVTEAYEILGDPEKRRRYDTGESAGFGGGGGFHGFDGSGGFNFSDIFSDIFGENNHRQPKRHTKGDDIVYNITIDLKDAFFGKKENIIYNSMFKCEKCHGSGSENGAAPEKCNNCYGSGRVTNQRGFLAIETTCPVCNGMGEIVKNACKECSGSGQHMKRKNLSVDIPAGVDSKMKIKISGHGHAGYRGSSYGDLYVNVNVENHEFFKREGIDLYCKIPLKLSTAILGGSVSVPYLDGKEYDIKIPEGTQSGSKFRLKDRGMPEMRSGRRGFLYVEVGVETPVKLNKRQRELVEEFATLEDDGSNPIVSSFINKIKKWWQS